MPARKPEECDTLLCEALNRGDLEAAVALYEPTATFVAAPGKILTGHAGVCESMQGFLAIKPKFTISVNAVENGDIAVLRSKWNVNGTGADGKPVAMSGNGIEVVRRQSDGTWKFIIDNPNGAD